MSDKPDRVPSVIVIFGITGDLAQRKLLPALYHLGKQDLLHEQTVILGVSRRDVKVDDLLKTTELCVLEQNNVCDPAAIKKLRDKLRMYQMDLDDSKAFENLQIQLQEIEAGQGICLDRLYYLSVPPQAYAPLVQHLGEHGLNDSCEHGKASSRLLVEKPFGYDLASAEELVDTLTTQFKEEQIYRIDHYLAKETVQNILTFRLENPLWGSLWNREHITHITITASEQIGIEGRAIFYDSTGALRDFIQSHLLQLLAVTAMEPPADLTSASIQAARLQLLQSIVPIDPKHVSEQAFRAQYDGYREDAAKPNSTTETMASIKLYIDNERWQGIPITLRSAKKVAEKSTVISLTFDDDNQDVRPNHFNFFLQPSEGIGIDVQVKKPGYDNQTETALMDFSYNRSFENEAGHPDAYERVLVDAIRGDRTLFTTSDEVLTAWRIVDPVLQAWQKSSASPARYSSGTPIEQVDKLR